MLAGRDADAAPDVVARVRAALAAPAGGHGGAGGRGRRAGAAVRRARRDRRRVLVPAAVALAVLAGAAVLAPRAATDPAVATSGAAGSSGPWGSRAAGPADPLVAASLLDLDQVSALVPGVTGRAPAADVTPLRAAGSPPPRYSGGWCGDAVLLGAPPPEQVWAAEWLQEGLAGTAATRGPAGAVREVVLRWPDAAGARAWADATHASPTRCRDPRGAPFPLTVFRPWTVATSASSLVSVAVAPAGATGASGLPGADVWRVRAVHARGTTVVDLTVVVRSPEPREAVRSSTALLEAAAARAEQGERGEPR